MLIMSVCSGVWQQTLLTDNHKLVHANQLEITYSSVVRNAVAGTVSSGRLTGIFTAPVNPMQAYAVIFRNTAPGVSTVTSVTQRFSSGGE